MVSRTATVLSLAVVLSIASPGGRTAARQEAPAQPDVTLAPTSHPAIPDDPDQLWLAPTPETTREGDTAALLRFADGVNKFALTKYAEALPLLRTSGVASTELADYATYYTGLAQVRGGDVSGGRATLERLSERPLNGYLAQASVLARAEAAEHASDFGTAVSLYESLMGQKTIDPQIVLYRLARAASSAGDRQKAAAAFRRIRYEFPMSDEAALADTELESLHDIEPRPNTAATFKQDMGRAERLFGARRYAQAREAFQAIRSLASGDDREVVGLRIAESDYYLRRSAQARDGLRPYLSDASRKAEAQFFYIAAIRDLGNIDEYLQRVRALVDAFPESSWAEEALNNLATHYILVNDDQSAAAAFKELLDKFPKGSRAERAAWKYGWWSYKNGNYADAVRVFETAAANFPRSDYRPSYVYWSARARERQGQQAQALARYRLVTTDYLNSYYGRLAEGHVATLQKAVRASNVTSTQSALPADDPTPAAALPPTASLIRLLLSVGLDDAALNELRYAQRQWGTSPAIEATIAWIYYRKGDLRRAIIQMKRAYPQHLSEDAENKLPDDLLRVIFPLDYWPSIRQSAQARGLDPYLVAALIAQESTFDAGVRSAANAWGLMQIVPSTGRRLAKTLKVRYRGTSTLTQPDVNIRMGTLYFSGLVQQFGGVHLALAAYNAGEQRVVRWMAERPGLDRDEFIDDIPFPETQNYVKKIIGTAEDYRVLYGERGARPVIDRAPEHLTKRVTVSSKPAKKPKKAPPKKKTSRSKH